MLFELLTLASDLAAREHVESDLAVDAAYEARDIVLELPPFCSAKDEYTSRLCGGLLLVAMQYGEARFQVDIIGDGGKSFGPMQMRKFWTLGRKTEDGNPLRVEHFLASRRQALLTAYTVLLELKKTCGSTKRALYGYMSGRCEGTPKALRETEKRCTWIGGCP